MPNSIIRHVYKTTFSHHLNRFGPRVQEKYLKKLLSGFYEKTEFHADFKNQMKKLQEYTSKNVSTKSEGNHLFQIFYDHAILWVKSFLSKHLFQFFSEMKTSKK
jgi:hypothetical protein